MTINNKESVYLGGERDDQDQIMPVVFEDFFSKKLLFLVFALLTILLIASLLTK